MNFNGYLSFRLSIKKNIKFVLCSGQHNSVDNDITICKGEGYILDFLIFLTKINDIHSFKLIEYIDTMQIR